MNQSKRFPQWSWVMGPALVGCGSWGLQVQLDQMRIPIRAEAGSFSGAHSPGTLKALYLTLEEGRSNFPYPASLQLAPPSSHSPAPRKTKQNTHTDTTSTHIQITHIRRAHIVQRHPHRDTETHPPAATQTPMHMQALTWPLCL